MSLAEPEVRGLSGDTFFAAPLSESDPEIDAAVRDELQRQREKLEKKCISDRDHRACDALSHLNHVSLCRGKRVAESNNS